MSDVERPTNGGQGGAGGPPSSGLPARNMADIARLFLEGARPLPARVPPTRRGPKGTEPESGTAGKPEVKANQPAKVTKTSAPTTALLGLAGTKRDIGNWGLLLQAAQGMAQEMATAVAVVGLLSQGNKTYFTVDVAGVESAAELPAVRMGSEGGSADMQIARALHRLAPAVGLWIISAPGCEARTFSAIGSIVREWLLVCPTENDGLVAGYQYLKQAWGAARAGAEGRIVPSVYLLAEDYAQAAVVHKRLRKAAQEFLGTDLALAGAGLVARGEAGAQEPIRALSVACPGPEDAVWAAVLDELCPMTEGEESFPPTEIESAMDAVENNAGEVALRSAKSAAAALDHLAQVLDPEEREALAADFAEPGVPVATARRTPREVPVPETLEPPIFREEVSRGSEDKLEVSPAREAVATAPTVVEARPVPMELATSLRAFDLERSPDRPAQWQAVERSIWDLAPRSALLEARPPMSWASETCIAIDGQGRVNVWTLYKDGASWFALREWASEHRNLLALTRRDLVVDKGADVMVHMVLPLEDGAGAGGMERQDGVAPMLLRAQGKNLHLYRMRTLEWNGRRGLVVVPLA